MDVVEKIARTCLYEGYLLWPYRRSALKNAKRWTFGGIYPRACAAVLGEPSRMQTQVLLEADDDTDVAVRVRFLHVVDRTVLRHTPTGSEPVDELSLDGRRHLSWQEAAEREVLIPATGWSGRQGARPGTTELRIPGGSDREPLVDRLGREAGALVRSWRPLQGTASVDAVPVAEGLLRLTVRIDNCTPCPQPAAGDRNAREAASAYAFVSTHTVLHTRAGRFLSLADPPPQLRGAAASCENLGTWPVLVGEAVAARGDRPVGARTVLSAPVTLYDFPEVAPESPGDLFDGTEIDQLLILSILSLTDEEREEARASDPRAREILERCAALGPEELMGLHGAIRALRPIEGARAMPAVGQMEDA